MDKAHGTVPRLCGESWIIVPGGRVRVNVGEYKSQAYLEKLETSQAPLRAED